MKKTSTSDRRNEQIFIKHQGDAVGNNNQYQVKRKLYQGTRDNHTSLRPLYNQLVSYRAALQIAGTAV